MTKRTRPALATHYSGPRAGDRDLVSLEGRCSVGDNAAEAIAVLDLDARGCRVKGITAAVTKADRLELWLGEMAPIEGRLRWAKRGSAGIVFVAPLTDNQLEAIRRTAAPAPTSEVIPLRRRQQLVT